MSEPRRGDRKGTLQALGFCRPFGTRCYKKLSTGSLATLCHPWLISAAASWLGNERAKRASEVPFPLPNLVTTHSGFHARLNSALAAPVVRLACWKCGALRATRAQSARAGSPEAGVGSLRRKAVGMARRAGLMARCAS
jgi:hypothetical protein